MSARAAMTVQERLLDDVATLRASTAELKARLDQNDREFARMKRGGAPPERRHVSLEEARRLGLLPRSARTIRTWLATPETRSLWKTDLFLRRVAGRIEVDLVGLETWRRAMAAPTAPEWPKRFGRSPS
jgi:hypothetical protein